jgi:hypothetical protein
MAKGAARGRAKALALVLLLGATSCMTYRGPRGVEDVIEERLGCDLDRTFGLSLGPISTKIAASFVDESEGTIFHGLTGVGVAVFQVDAARAHAMPALTAQDIAGAGWEAVLTSRTDDDQVIVLVKSRRGKLHEMMLVAIDGDEVVLARLRGKLDEIVREVVAAAESEGSLGARRAIGFEGS